MIQLNNYKAFLFREEFNTLIEVLIQFGYTCYGPQVTEQAIVYKALESVDQLPKGYTDQQQPGYYRLKRSSNSRYFSWANASQALKPLVFKAREKLWSVQKAENGELKFSQNDMPGEKIAVIGVKACDLAGLQLLDNHYLHQDDPDSHYKQRRDNLLFVAVNCSNPAETCFCASTGDGPQVTSGYDLALSELDDGFLINANSKIGEAVLNELPCTASSDEQRQVAAAEIQQASKAQTRKVPLRNLQQLLSSKLEHPRWDEVAGRCLSCGNCTMVCPSCFCHAQVEEAALDSSSSDHYRQWDSCFTQGHSYIHGVTIRPDTRTRYRQWLMHKFAYWHEQFGRSGCVGCGRCITWCPVGIDVTQELAALTEGVVSE